MLVEAVSQCVSIHSHVNAVGVLKRGSGLTTTTLLEASRTWIAGEE